VDPPNCIRLRTLSFLVEVFFQRLQEWLHPDEPTHNSSDHHRNNVSPKYDNRTELYVALKEAHGALQEDVAKWRQVQVGWQLPTMSMNLAHELP